MMKREEYNYWMANIPKIGARKTECLRRAFGNSEGVYRASETELIEIMGAASEEGEMREVRFAQADIPSIINSRNPEMIRKGYEDLKRKGVRMITIEDGDYPSRLRHVYDAPFVLYVKGDLPQEESSCIAIVGARECSVYGREMAKYLAQALAAEGVNIISGLARGIDACAHEGALRAGGSTFGVMGCGIDICYPEENIKLYMEVQKEGNGGVISEYRPGTKPLAGHFPMRNRIISGMSDGILVIEAKERSGSLITADLALEQGKDIYALPGRATDCLSAGCNRLIRMGAKMVTSPEDILEDIIVLKNLNKNSCRPEPMKEKSLKLRENQRKIYECLDYKGMHIEELAALTSCSLVILMEELVEMELAGLISQPSVNYYARSG